MKKTLLLLLVFGILGLNVFAVDTDLDGVDDSYDNCVYVPNMEQQDLDDDGEGTSCDYEEFDMSVTMIKPDKTYGVISQDFGWGVYDAYGCTTPWCSLFHGFSSFYPGPFEEPYPGDLSDIPSVVILPQPFGDAEWGTYPNLTRVYYNPGAVKWENHIEISEMPGCVSNVTAAPFSLTGVEYTYGFNEACTDYLLAQSASTDLEVTLGAMGVFNNIVAGDVYIDWDGARINMTGQNFTVTDPTGVVFEVEGRPVRVSLPVLLTSGEDVTAVNNITPYETLVEESGNAEQGVYDTLDYLAGSDEYGLNTVAAVGHLEVACGDGGCLVTSVISGTDVANLPEDTRNIAVTNFVTRADMDAINMAATGDLSPRVLWDHDMHVGSMIPAVATSFEIAGPLTVYMYPPEEMDVTDAGVLDGAVGLASMASIVNIHDAVFESANGYPYIGNAFAVSMVDIANTTWNDAVDGFIAVNSDVDFVNSQLNTLSESELAGFDITPVVSDATRAKAVLICAEDSTYYYLGGETITLPNGENLWDTALIPLFSSLGSIINCNMNIEGSNLNAGEKIGVLVLADKTTNPITISNTVINNTKVALFVGGYGQDLSDPKLVVNVDNIDALDSQVGFVAAGHLDLDIADSEFTGSPSDSWMGGAASMSASGFLQRVLGYENLVPVANWNDMDVSIERTSFSGFGTSANAAKPAYSPWAQRALTVFDSEEYASNGTVYLEDVTATGDSGNTIAVYGEPTIATAGDVPDVDYPECSGTSRIAVKVTSNNVHSTGVPGQQPLANATVLAYDKTGCADYFPDAFDVMTNCPVISSCKTDATGQCTIKCLTAGDYFVAVNSTAYSGKYPSHAVGGLAEGETRYARFSFLADPAGDVRPAKSTKHSGSELWIYEPSYVLWDGTEEFYPFVFETSDGTWTVDVCLNAPQGYEPDDGVECLQTIVPGEPRSILFRLVETGSVPGKVKVKMNLVDPHGKKLGHTSEIDSLLSAKLAKAKGVAIDKNGRILRSGLTEAPSSGFLGSAVGIVLLVVIATLLVAVFLKCREPKPRKR